MGLCKCPKKKVTTQFCFEHRVNVCEHCLVSSHPRVSELELSSIHVKIKSSIFMFSITDSVMYVLSRYILIPDLTTEIQLDENVSRQRRLKN